MEASLGIKVFLENDSRAMAFGEFSSGVVNDEQDVLFLNLDYGLRDGHYAEWTTLLRKIGLCR